jgi:hypothetical protein
MRLVKATSTTWAAATAVLVLAACGAGCGAKESRGGVTLAGAAGGPAGGGAPGTSGTGAAGTAGSAGASTGTAGTGGLDPTGAAGTVMPGTVPSGAGGSVDQGHLFTDAAVVPSSSDDAGAAAPPEAGTGGDAAKSAPGDGNTSTCHVGGMSFVLVFTQKGTDVTMVVTASNCATGNHTIQIHGGFSCDNAGTEGGVWDGMRGAGIPALSCANNKGSLTYTRSGADPTTNWTVGDHNTKTDVTLHPMSVDSSCGTFF